jgi:hypothetical protein
MVLRNMPSLSSELNTEPKFSLEDEGSMLLQNTGTHLLDNNIVSSAISHNMNLHCYENLKSYNMDCIRKCNLLILLKLWYEWELHKMSCYK